MQFLQALNKLHESDIFNNWKTKNAILTYGFLMISPDIKEEWQIGYYNKTSDKIIAFTVADEITQNPESEVFKDKKTVLELDFTSIKINMDKAIIKADELQKSKYKAHDPVKKMVIIQKLSLGQVWNITYITKTFKTLNIKVDAKTGDILKYDLLDLFKFDK